MACRDAYKMKNTGAFLSNSVLTEKTEIPKAEDGVERLIFGVDSQTPADTRLQNNIDHFEWVVRNKIYPGFAGRALLGKDCLTKEEIEFLHDRGCKIALICPVVKEKESETQGREQAVMAVQRANELDIPLGTAIFLEINDKVVGKAFLKGYAEYLLESGYTPGFYANTDAKYSFDREFSRGMQTEPHVFKNCLIWALAPTLEEYDGMTTTHLIHPDNWRPFAPSAVTRKEIAIWQYGKDCHPICDDRDQLTTFNLNLVRNEWVITKKMF